MVKLSEGVGALVPQVLKNFRGLQRACALWLVAGLFLFCTGKVDSKTLPSYLQKAYVIQKAAFVYSRPDFDSLRITQIPAGQIITISKKVYKPKNLFGTFYRVYLKKPKKIKAYISEIDVTPRFIKSGAGYIKNPAFGQAKKKLSHITDFEAHSLSPPEETDKVFDLRLLGMSAGYGRPTYKHQASAVSAYFFALKLTGPGLPIPNLVTDFTLAFSPSNVSLGRIHVQKPGFMVLGDMLLKIPVINSDPFVLFLSGGWMIKWKQVLAAPVPPSYRVGAGLAATVGASVKMNKNWIFLLENKFYYDLLESRIFPLWIAGVLLVF